ncbi:hypothetical protein GQ43DRAFT_445418 [Delitschia confertaspora ATCC 74209]|uniref:Uncharacterized protein n=1 Tax=Delitschia confertaspora ATCC 74209 TaxID=1513339 RepID=A0A9P4MMM8_9PLEO|nr:hypothetical protein GQ43DRAFT_445418 [Delitschia confertaspora ATCC 74209]
MSHVYDLQPQQQQQQQQQQQTNKEYKGGFEKKGGARSPKPNNEPNEVNENNIDPDSVCTPCSRP